MLKSTLKQESGCVNIVLKELKQLGSDVFQVYWTLVKIMVPSLIIVKILEELGAIQWLAILLKPVMAIVGLPPEMGIVWATSLLTNIYTAMAVYFELAISQPLSVAQVSVLGTLILIGHALPIEGAITKKAGVRWRVTLLLRIGGALLLGAVLNASYHFLNAFQEPSVLMWQPAKTDDSLPGWILGQIKILVTIPFIIALLMIGLRLLRLLGIEKIMHWMLNPLLRFLGMSKAAANSTVIGVTLGLSFGGGLLIQEAKAGKMTRKDILLSMSLVCLCHSLIEDTLLIMLLGADLSALLWSRLAFTFIIIAFIAKLIKSDSKDKILNYSMD
jgi:hypothetical protein